MTFTKYLSSSFLQCTVKCFCQDSYQELVHKIITEIILIQSSILQCFDYINDWYFIIFLMIAVKISVLNIFWLHNIYYRKRDKRIRIEWNKRIPCTLYHHHKPTVYVYNFHVLPTKIYSDNSYSSILVI